jgi:methionyl-tRNA formyltransferase
MATDPIPRALLVGCGPTALTALESLAGHLVVVGLVRDCDPAAPEVDPTARRAAELGVPVTTETSATAIERLIDETKPHCVVVSSYSRILPARVVSKTRFVNVHYALLPRYRGVATVNWAVINGEAETGITVHVLTPDLDAGNILFQQAVPIGSADTVGTLHEALNAIQRRHLGPVVARHLRGYEGEPQDRRAASYGCARLPRDGEIDWSAPTRRAYDLVRGLTPPYPGAFTYFEGQPLTVWWAEPVADPPRYDGRVPGRVVRVFPAEGWVEVLTGDGVLRVREVQRPGGPRRPAAEVIRSVRCTLGLSVADLLERIRALESARTK